MPLLLLALPWYSLAALLVAGLLLLVIALNWEFYKFLANCATWRFALSAIPAHLLYFLCSVAGFAIAAAQFHLHPRREVRPRNSSATTCPTP
jgi:hypothetical protein